MAEDDKKMLEMLKSLGVPLMKDPEELRKFMTEYGAGAGKVKTSMNPPRISTFFGEENRGEVSYPTWAYEVNCLIAEKTFSDEVILQAIRRSVKGHAADQLRYVGIKPTIENVLENFEDTYGMVETPETILKKFYACKQNSDESVANYCFRLEDIHTQAVEMNALAEGDDMLRRVFYRGLTSQLRNLANFKFETVKDYRSLKKEVRQIANELEEEKTESSSTEKKTKCHAVNKKDEKVEQSKLEEQFGAMTSMMEKINTRMEQLEKQQQDQNVFLSTADTKSASTAISSIWTGNQ